MTQSLLRHRREAIQKSAVVQVHAATLANRLQLLGSALARWDGEGGAGPGGRTRRNQTRRKNRLQRILGTEHHLRHLAGQPESRPVQQQDAGRHAASG